MIQNLWKTIVADKYLHVRYNYAGKQLTAKLQSQVKVESADIQNLLSLAASDILYEDK